MENLKADGTYIASSGAAVNYYNKLLFIKDSYTEQTLAHSDQDYDMNTSYFIGDKSVSEDEFLSFCDTQNSKNDALWYDYTAENIEQMLQ